MSAGNRKGLRKIDRMTFSLYLGLITIGWLMIYAVGYGEESTGHFFSTQAGKQSIWVAISLFSFLLIQLIDWNFWRTFAYPIYIVSMVLLVAVLIFGAEIKGATSWFVIGGFSFQPSELAKFATCLAMAGFLSTYSTDLKDFRSQLIAFGIFLLPMMLILIQPDAGSALVFFSFLLVLYRKGLSPNYYIVGIFLAGIFLLSLKFGFPNTALGLLLLSILVFAYHFNGNKRNWLLGALSYTGVAIYLVLQGYTREMLLTSLGAFVVVSFFLWKKRRSKMVGLMYTAVVVGSLLAYLSNYAFYNVLQPHQQDRINVWLRPEKCDPRGSLYNVLQSKMAISSGGIEGKGFTEGTMTKLNYVPEQATDFIFCTIGEEQGFIGSFAIIALFLLLLLRITTLAERQRSAFSRHYAYGVAGFIFVHFFINIGMTMGLMPIIGIPLPFISKGGSSLLGFTIMIAVLLKLDSNRYRV